MTQIWSKRVTEAHGPIIVLEGISNPKHEEEVVIKLNDGKELLGRVLEAHQDKAIIQVFSSTIGVNTSRTKARLTGSISEISVGKGMLGRVFSGMGQAIDGLPQPIGTQKRSLNGLPINPYSREYPHDFIQTGISTIDGLSTLVRGQKLPIFSMSGLPHSQIAAQIAKQAKTISKTSKSTNFAIVFAAIGTTFAESNYFMESFRQSGALKNTVLFINQANDPIIERVMTPRIALTTAEYLAYQHDLHVLVIMTDITNYCNALREISAARSEIPGRRGYPGYMYTDLASLYERAGRITGSNGSVTQIPILTMPDDDKTHPIPDLTGYITEGQIALSRDLHRSGVHPPIDVLGSLSRLKDKGVGEGKTREDHSGLANQLFAAYAKGKELIELAQILGESSLSQEDQKYLEFMKSFETLFIHQNPDEDRSIIDTLDLGWSLLKILPRSELKRVKLEHIKKYMK